MTIIPYERSFAGYEGKTELGKLKQGSYKNIRNTGNYIYW